MVTYFAIKVTNVSSSTAWCHFSEVGRFLESKPFSLFFIIFGVLSRDWFIASCKFCYLQNNTNHSTPTNLGHFWIILSLFLETSLGAHPFIWTWDLIQMKIKLRKDSNPWPPVYRLGALMNKLKWPIPPKVSHKLRQGHEFEFYRGHLHVFVWFLISCSCQHFLLMS